MKKDRKPPPNPKTIQLAKKILEDYIRHLQEGTPTVELPFKPHVAKVRPHLQDIESWGEMWTRLLDENQTDETYDKGIELIDTWLAIHPMSTIDRPTLLLGKLEDGTRPHVDTIQIQVIVPIARPM